MQYLLNFNGLTVKWILIQYILCLTFKKIVIATVVASLLSENFNVGLDFFYFWTYGLQTWQQLFGQAIQEDQTKSDLDI